MRQINEKNVNYDTTIEVKLTLRELLILKDACVNVTFAEIENDYISNYDNISIPYSVNDLDDVCNDLEFICHSNMIH